MVYRRRLILLLGASALVTPFASLAQTRPAPVIHRIGYLAARSRSTLSNPDPYYDAFVAGMREHGYVEGKNLIVEWRFADGKYERLDALAAELVASKVEIIVTHATPPSQAAHRATKTIPIVTGSSGDPIGDGLAKSLAHPGGNVTGLSLMSVDLSGKWLELLKIISPKLSRVGVLVNPGSTIGPLMLEKIRIAAQTLSLDVIPVEARSPEEIERAVAVMTKNRVDGVIVQADSFFLGQRQQIAQLTIKYRLPSISPFREQTAAGGLISYGQDLADHYRRSATFVDKILKGAKPADLPFEQPTKIHLAINRKTAKALGLTISPELFLRADELIE